MLIWQQEVTQGTLLLVLLLVRPLLATDIVINAARCRVRCVSELQRVNCTNAIVIIIFILYSHTIIFAIL